MFGKLKHFKGKTDRNFSSRLKKKTQITPRHI